MQDTTKAPAESIAVGACVPGTPYRVVGMLGAANAGSVYEVEHVELGKRFALKALPRRAARFDTVGRLKNEWRALARLAHPNIIAVTDAGTTPDGLPFFVMERLEGESLRARLEREGRLRASEAIGIAAGVAAALGAAHRIGVVHRDVKPESIFLARGGRVKLQDFGLAKLHSAPSKLTSARRRGRHAALHGARAGTGREGRSPRRLLRAGAGAVRDAGGRGPFDDAEDTGAMLLRRATGKAPSLATRAGGLPADLDALVAELLARNPASRPPDARSIADELQQIGSRLLAPVTHDSPTREACYSAETRPTIVPPANSAATRPGPPPRVDAAGQTRPDGIAARSSAPPPAAALDPNATALAIPVRRAVPPPLPVAAAQHTAIRSTPLSSSPPVAAPARPAVGLRPGPSRRAVAKRAALIGAGAAVLLLCCLALGWVLVGGESVARAAHADLPPHAALANTLPTRPRAARPAASSQSAPAPLPVESPKPAPRERPTASARPARPRPAHRRTVVPVVKRPSAAASVAAPRSGGALPASAPADATSMLCHPEIPTESIRGAAVVRPVAASKRSISTNRRRPLTGPAGNLVRGESAVT